MTEITVRIPDQDLAQFLIWLEEHGYEHSSPDADIPEWQRKLVADRMATNKPEDYKPWEEVRERVFGKYRPKS